MFEHIDMLSKSIPWHPYKDIPTLLVSDFGVLGHMSSRKRCHFVMVEADSHLKLLPPSILDIYKVFEHIDMLSKSI